MTMAAAFTRCWQGATELLSRILVLSKINDFWKECPEILFDLYHLPQSVLVNSKYKCMQKQRDKKSGRGTSILKHNYLKKIKKYLPMYCNSKWK